VSSPTPAGLAEAAARLRRGDVVAFPTETVYGLGADALNAAAIRKVFTLKGRPWNNPLIVHVLDPVRARNLVRTWDDRCDRLAARFWPGPLTLVLRNAAHVPAEASAGLDTIAVRCPAHPVARRLLADLGGPIAAPSANRSGHVSPTTAMHVADDFADVTDLMILDGGPCALGLESTVLDLSVALPRILRPGSVTPAMLVAEVGEVEAPLVPHQAASPGTSPVHYAPRTPARLVEHAALVPICAASNRPVAILAFNMPAVANMHRVIQMPAEPAAYAAKLYGALREADAMNPGMILIERPGETGGLWTAIDDRLRRATGG
jgi:L-threonylcarbamoyladenylate synthase